MESMSIVSSCSKEASQGLKSAEPEQEVKAAHDLLSACTEAAEQQATFCKEAQDQW